MPKHHRLLSLFVCVGLWSQGLAAFGQALLPYSPKLDAQKIEQQGLELAEDAIQLIRFQQTEAALSRAKLSTQLAPGHFQTWFILGTLYLQQEEVDKSIEVLNRALALEPKEAGIFFTLGSAYFQKEDYQTAITEIEKGLKLKSDNPSAWFDLGNSYYKLGKYPKAISSYEKALSVEKQFWPAINNIGLIKYEQGDMAAAIKNWQTALTIDKEQPEPQLALAVATYAQGRRDEGLKMAITALTLDNRYADLKFLEENLWGQRLLKDTKTMLDTPQMQEVIVRLQAQSSSE